MADARQSVHRARRETRESPGEISLVSSGTSKRGQLDGGTGGRKLWLRTGFDVRGGRWRCAAAASARDARAMQLLVNGRSCAREVQACREQLLRQHMSTIEELRIFSLFGHAPWLVQGACTSSIVKRAWSVGERSGLARARQRSR